MIREEKTLGEYTFYISPMNPFVANTLFGDLQRIILPALAAGIKQEKPEKPEKPELPEETETPEETKETRDAEESEESEETEDEEANPD